MTKLDLSYLKPLPSQRLLILGQGYVVRAVYIDNRHTVSRIHNFLLVQRKLFLNSSVAHGQTTRAPVAFRIAHAYLCYCLKNLHSHRDK